MFSYEPELGQLPGVVGRVSHAALAAALLRQAVFEAAGIVDQEATRRGKRRGGAKTEGQSSAEQRAADEIRAEAYDWLTTPSDSLDFWCRVARIDMDTVIDGADGAIKAVRKGERAPGGGRKRK